MEGPDTQEKVPPEKLPPIPLTKPTGSPPIPSPDRTETPPPQTAPPPPATPLPPQTTPPPPSIQKPRKLLVIPLLLLLLLFLLGTVIVFAVGYQGTKLPFVSKEISFQLQKTYANLPLVPKAPRHILLQSLDSSLKIETFSFDASMSMEGFDLYLYGEAEIKENTANFDLHLTAKSSGLSLPLTLEADVINLNDILYFKIGTFSSSALTAFWDLGPAVGKWWKVDLSTLETQAREELEKEQEEGAETLTQQVPQKALELFSKPGILEEVTRGKDEKIGGEVSYHLRVALTKELYLRLVEALQEESLTDEERENFGELFEMIEKLEMDLWIGKDTLVARKFKLLFKLKSPAEDALDLSTLFWPSNALEGVLVLEIPRINTPVSISAPEGAQDVEELIELLFGTQQLFPEVLGEQVKRFLRER